MEAARIVGSMPVITGHMKEVGYSSNYIKGLERSARWLVEMAGRCGSWDEVFEAVDDAWDSVSARGSVRCQLRLIRQYDELGVLPRSEGCVRYARRGSRDGLCEGFSSVVPPTRRVHDARGSLAAALSPCDRRRLASGAYAPAWEKTGLLGLDPARDLLLSLYSHTAGRIGSCDWWGKCTSSPYGRVIKTYDRTDYKLFGPVPHGSDGWRDIYRDRTCTERVNNRVLNDYGVHSLTCRNGPKHFLFAVMACINIHLDAWLKTAAWRRTIGRPRPPGAPNRRLGRR